MAHPISIRLDDLVREELEQDASRQGVPLATYLREMAATRAREVRRARIREQSRQVGVRTSTSRAASDFYDEIGTPGSVLPVEE